MEQIMKRSKHKKKGFYNGEKFIAIDEDKELPKLIVKGPKNNMYFIIFQSVEYFYLRQFSGRGSMQLRVRKGKIASKNPVYKVVGKYKKMKGWLHEYESRK